jgi:hypothetical protein
MNNVFQLINRGIKFSWNPEEITKDFKVVVDDQSKIASLPGRKAHWQYFDSGIYFSRNFNIEFPNHCQEVVDSLIEMQDKLFRRIDNNSTMVNLFLNHVVRINNVLLVKVVAGKSVDLHYDRTRSCSINIGLKNSNTCLTHVYSGARVADTLIDEKNIKHTYQMYDGDAYIIGTCQPHSVESLTHHTETNDRYIISYCLI